MPSSLDWFKEFEFDLPTALLNDLVRLLDGMGQAPLDASSLSEIPEQQGVYQLFFDDDLAYVGKTDSEAGLNKRLARHANKVKQRINLDPGRVSFKAVRIYIFTALDLEQDLIKHYTSKSASSLAWNRTGFGANDPGRERDTTKLKAGHFDLLHSIDIDVPLGSSSIIGTLSVADALKKLKIAVPYLIRVQNIGGGSRKPHPDLVSATITIPPAADTARKVLRLIQSALGSTWQVTVLPGYVILYRENRPYPHALVL